jgi:1,2-diacylglycerol 3-alpha-glucosyltransferase
MSATARVDFIMRFSFAKAPESVVTGSARVVVAASGLGHVARGIEAWAADLGRALAARGVAVTVCKGGGRAEEPFERVLPCWQREAGKTRRLLDWLPRRVSWRIGLGSGYGVEQNTFALQLLRHLRREQADVLHVQDPQVALIVQRARRVGLVSTRTILAHGTEEPLAFQRKITYLQHLAPWHLEEARAAGVWRPTWTAIPNFIDTELFRLGPSVELRKELGIPAEGLVVLTAAAIKRQHKRIDYLLDEFARLRQAHPALPVWLVVAGGWEPETDELVERGRELLGERVRFLVRFPRQRMPELYRCADLFALCSLKEMMPIALLEATASGLPCLVNRHPVLHWMIGPGGNAVDMAAPGALAAALQPLLCHHAERRRLGALARVHCVEHFSRDRVVDQILDYYRFVRGHGRSDRKLRTEPVARVGP